MPSVKESKMNLSALKQVDPEINEIVDSATQVALYQYSTQTGEWAKTEVEGALFIYAHRNPHKRGVIILNRHSPKNYKEPIRADIEFKIKTPFLIYKTSTGHIYGAWFYVEEECVRIGNLCCRLVSYLKKRGKKPSANATASSNNNDEVSGSGIEISSVLQNLLPPTAAQTNQETKGANIMSLLKRAQSEEKPTGNVAQAQQQKKQPLASNSHNNANGGNNGHAGKQNGHASVPNGTGKNHGKQESNGGGHRRSQTGSESATTPGVPVVHKPVPTKALPSSVEQLFQSAVAAGGGITALHYKPPEEAVTSKTPGRGRPGPVQENPLERLLGLQIDSPPLAVPLAESKPIPITKRSARDGVPASSTVTSSTTPPPVMNACMASILNKLNESAQKAREAEVVRNSPTEESILRNLLQNAGGGVVQTGLATTPPSLPGGITLPQSASSLTGTSQDKKLTLITPEMLEESLSQGPSTPPQSVMSRAELKSALVYLLETDDDFLGRIHQAYLQGAVRRKFHMQ